jgi:hypothetical protein
MGEQMSARDLGARLRVLVDPDLVMNRAHLMTNTQAEALLTAWRDECVEEAAVAGDRRLVWAMSQWKIVEAERDAANENSRMMQDRLQRLIDGNLRMREALEKVAGVNAHLESHNGKNVAANQTLEIARKVLYGVAKVPDPRILEDNLMAIQG